MAFFIETVPDDQAEGSLRELYDADVQNLGYVANYSRAFSLRPEVMKAWQNLGKTIVSNMELRHFQLATLAAATSLRSSYCSLAYGNRLRQVYDDAQLSAIARGDDAAELEPAERALTAFARKVALEAHRIDQQDVDTLREAGFSDAAILDIALAAAARCFFSKVLDAVGAQPDPAFAALEPPLREALTVGRPIAGETNASER